MEQVALHTRLKEGREADYERIHATIPTELDAALREAGVHGWRIWRSGRDLFHLVDVEDFEAMLDALRDHPADVAWQQRIGELLESPGPDSGDLGLPLVWKLR